MRLKVKPRSTVVTIDGTNYEITLTSEGRFATPPNRNGKSELFDTESAAITALKERLDKVRRTKALKEAAKGIVAQPEADTEVGSRYVAETHVEAPAPKSVPGPWLATIIVPASRHSIRFDVSPELVLEDVLVRGKSQHTHKLMLTRADGTKENGVVSDQHVLRRLTSDERLTLQELRNNLIAAERAKAALSEPVVYRSALRDAAAEPITVDVDFDSERQWAKFTAEYLGQSFKASTAKDIQQQMEVATVRVLYPWSTTDNWNRENDVEPTPTNGNMLHGRKFFKTEQEARAWVAATNASIEANNAQGTAYVNLRFEFPEGAIY